MPVLNKRMRERWQNAPVNSIVLGSWLIQQHSIVADLAHRAAPSTTITDVRFEQPLDPIGSVVLSCGQFDDIPVLLADQAALDAWDDAQRVVEAFVEADVNGQRRARKFIREE